MSKKHISRNAKVNIGKERIEILMNLAEKAVREGKEDRAARYVDIARRIGMKTRTGIPKEFRFCKGCFTPLVPGVSCTTRLNGHKVVTTCEICGTVRRVPYIREQRK